MLRCRPRSARFAVVAAAVFVGMLGATSVSAAPATAVVRPAAGAGVVAQKGDRSDTVKLIQQQLVAAGVSVPGGVDGIFGSGTMSAVTEFQKRKGLSVTGVVDVATATALGVVPAATILGRGARSDAVKNVQQQLVAVGLSPFGGADGVFGPATESAVRKFQQSKGLGVTGQIDAATAQILANAASKAATPVPAPAPAPAAGPAVLARPGNSGIVVVTLQKDLAAIGLRPVGGADGIFGAATVSKLKTFQGWFGLPKTGVYDQTTATTLTAEADKARAKLPAPNPVGTSSNGTVTLAVFPMPHRCSFGDTFGAPRSGGRRHEGVDILAPNGTTLFAVQDGTITRRMVGAALSGNALYLTAADGTYFFYAHLSAFADGISVGSKVKAGDVIGYVGHTGNAGIPHLHFEVHPRGGPAVNPYPIVKAVSGC